MEPPGFLAAFPRPSSELGERDDLLVFRLVAAPLPCAHRRQVADRLVVVQTPVAANTGPTG